MARTERGRLLDWYRRNARKLPWRETRDPWAIWVSEVMLQQTRVETVLAYWAPFLRRFPTVRAMARAPEDAVLSAWSGLGYYRRARFLHRAAKVVAAEHGGVVPADRAARDALPGVGRYTSGALGSIAFGLPEPIVDGNVARVLSRLRGLDTPIGTRASDEALWAEADALVQGDDPGTLNQALMELGATVCTPRAPRCDACPLAGSCHALRTARTEVLPVPRARKAPKPVSLVAVVVLDAKDRPWLVRSPGELFGGLFGPPMREGTRRDDALAALEDAGLRGTLGARWEARVEHVLTHRVLDVRVFCGRAAGRASANRRLSEPGAEIGVSKLAQKILSAAFHAAR